ncbi:MAG: hypothetical protein M3410_08535 [Acidobacteriota bacterium]|nr:hypothetical protein [Acidobacteriota bacterium]
MLAQSFALNVFSGNEVSGCSLADLVDGEDVGVIQGGRRFGFLNKTLQSRPISRDSLRQNLQRDGAV